MGERLQCSQVEGLETRCKGTGDMWNYLVKLAPQTTVPLGNELSTHSFRPASSLHAKAMPLPLATKEAKIIQVLKSATRIPRIRNVRGSAGNYLSPAPGKLSFSCCKLGTA